MLYQSPIGLLETCRCVSTTPEDYEQSLIRWILSHKLMLEQRLKGKVSRSAFTIYRPGSEVPTRQFFDQLPSVLECLITRNSQLLIMGDFNLPLKDQTDPDSISFRDILSQIGLRQHINETTHKLGGILDLVITADNEQVRDFQVQPPTISDHAYIQFWLPHLHSQPLHAIRN